MRRCWALVVSHGGEHAPHLLSWHWTEAGAWRRARATTTPLLNGDDQPWYEVRRRGEHDVPMDDLLDAELRAIVAEARQDP